MRWRLLLPLLLCAATLSVFAFDDDDDDDEGFDRPLARWHYFYDQRVSPRKEFPEGARLRAYRSLKALELAARAGTINRRSAATQGLWKLIGPRPVGFTATYDTSGRVTSLAVDPRDNDVAYAGAADGGVWKTTNAGQSWTPLTDDEPSLAIGSLAIDPSNPDTIYAGTGEENFSADAYTGVGILKSTDGGVSWINFVGPFLRQRIGGLAVHPSRPNILLAASNAGIYRSTDSGINWTSLLAGVGISVFFDPVQPNVAWASLGNINGAANNGVYRSTDAGATWTLTVGRAPNALPIGMDTGRIEVVNAPTGRDTAYAVVANRLVSGSATLAGIYRTNDAGATWTRFNTQDFCQPQCWYNLAIRPHPSDPNVIYAGGVDLIRTLNGGAGWNILPRNGAGGAPHVDHHALIFTADGTRLYDGNDGGVWRTNTAASTQIEWVNLNSTLALTQYYPNMSLHPTNPNIALAGAQDNGTHLYQGDPRWRLVIGGDGGWTAIDPSSPNIAFGSFVFITLFKTFRSDFADGFATVHGIDQTDRARFIGSYVLDPTNPQRMYYGTYRLYRSVDGGGLWRPISPDLTGAPPQTTSTVFTISTIAVAPTDPNRIYTGSPSGAVFGTTNGGTNWLSHGSGLPGRAVTHITVDPLDPATVYATFSGFAVNNEVFLGHVFRSTDGGNSWKDISGNLPNLPVNDLIVDPDLPDTLYIGTDLGVMVSSNSGATWDTLGTNLPRVAVPSLVLHRPTRTLRAATHGRSIWDYDLGPGAGVLPAITSLSPATRDAGSGDFTLTLTGTNFGPGMKVLWNGQERPVTAATATSISASIPASDVQVVGRAAVIVLNPSRGGGNSIPANFSIGPAPVVGNGGLVSSASSTIASAAPGSLISIYGAGFAASLAQAVGFPLPETLGGVVVSIGGIAAPIYFVSPNQINVQVPFELSLTTSKIVSVIQGTQVSASSVLQFARVAPSLFATNQQGTGQGAIRIANSATIAAPSGMFGDSRPVRAGEVIEVYCTGLGAVSPQVGSGMAAASRTLSNTLLSPTVTVGGAEAQVLFSGLAPGTAGLYQVNVLIPTGVNASDRAPVVLTIGGVQSNPVTVAVQ